MRFSFKKRIFIYFLAISLLYTIAIVFFEQRQEKRYRTEALQSQLNSYVEVVHNYINQKKLTKEALPEIVSIVETMPKELRVTIINNDGKVLFDKNIKDYNLLESHLDRIEIKAALYHPFGTNIRQSKSTQQEHLYYAKHFTDYFIRVALPYNIHTKDLLEADNYFIYITIILLIIVLFLLYFAVNRFNHSILDLRNLTLKVKNHEILSKEIEFPNDELGDISKELVEILNQKDRNKLEIEAEREKLRKHFEYSEEGLGIFNPNLKKIYVNTHFIQFANIITEKPTINVDTILEDDSFKDIINLVKERGKDDKSHTMQIEKNGKLFSIHSIIFQDNSFELTIKDITKIERNRTLKQEMTSNIAHELRTPVTILRGFLETLAEQELTTEQRASFTKKAYLQAIKLSELIEDVSLLSKIEEQNTSFDFQAVSMADLVDNVIINTAEILELNSTNISYKIDRKVMVKGNYNLLLSALLNLVENSLKYAGKHIEIQINTYTEDKSYYYFSYHDTGIGVDPQYINRLFERFYRINEGRDRNTGGSGLGLSIVRNIISLHKGDIQIKIHPSGGLQFLFKLEKYL